MAEANKDDAGATQIPLARVKRIIKTDPEVKHLASDAAFLIAKATELFLEDFAKQSLEHVQREGRKVVLYKDLARVVREVEEFEFLTDMIPEGGGGGKQQQ